MRTAVVGGSVEVAREDGVSGTAAAAHLEVDKLMKHLRASKVARRKMAPPAFVELITAGVGDSGAYVYRTEIGDRAGLRIHGRGIRTTEPGRPVSGARLAVG